MGYIKGLNISKEEREEGIVTKQKMRVRPERNRQREKRSESSGMQVCVSKMRGTVRGSGMPDCSQTLPLFYSTLSGFLATADVLQTNPCESELHPDHLSKTSNPDKKTFKRQAPKHTKPSLAAWRIK